MSCSPSAMVCGMGLPLVSGRSNDATPPTNPSTAKMMRGKPCHILPWKIYISFTLICLFTGCFLAGIIIIFVDFDLRQHIERRVNAMPFYSKVFSFPPRKILADGLLSENIEHVLSLYSIECWIYLPNKQRMVKLRWQHTPLCV